MKRILATVLAAFVALSAFAQDNIVYTDASAFPVFGKPVENTSARYERLPLSLKGVSRDDVWNLGRNSAGLYIRFRTNSTQIYTKWTSGGTHMPHMTEVGNDGLDLYARIGDEWRFVGSAFVWTYPYPKDKTRKVVSGMDPEMREYMLYLSLYDRVDSLQIGVDKDAILEGPELSKPSTEKPIVMYGTSILQGGCASRPGMAHTNIIARRLDREVINLGFSGNARLDYDIAELIAQIKDPGLIVLDNVPNSTAKIINERGEKFFEIIRKAHPDVPVIFVEDPIFPHTIVDKNMLQEVTSKNDAEKALFAKLKKQGAKNIYYVGAEGMTGDDGEAFVDGVHLTDLGMMRYVDHIMPTIKKALKKTK